MDGRQCIIEDSFWMVCIRNLVVQVVLKYFERVGEIKVRTYSRWPYVEIRFLTEDSHDV